MPQVNRRSPVHVNLIPFGRMLKRKRLEMGLSQYQFADKVGLSQSYISGFENARLKPTDDELLWLSQGFGCELEELTKAFYSTSNFEERVNQLEEKINQLETELDALRKELYSHVNNKKEG